MAREAYTDSTLIEKIKSGDEQAFAGLMHMYMSPLCAYVAYMVGSQDVAQDIVQDLWVRIWDIRKDLHIKGTVKGYLYRAAHNRALTAIKQRTNQGYTHQTAAEEAEVITYNEGDRITDSDSMRSALKKVVNDLRSPTREIFILRFVQNLEYSEIAETLNIPVANVHVAVSRSTDRVLEKLREMI